MEKLTESFLRCKNFTSFELSRRGKMVHRKKKSGFSIVESFLFFAMITAFLLVPLNRICNFFFFLVP